jgi:uncharacterized protein YjbI with pentapeptide repeats
MENWNKWREENPGIAPDLNEAELYWTNLIKATLSEADLRRADLRVATLIDTKPRSTPP